MKKELWHETLENASQAQTIAEIKDDVTAYETVLGKNEHTRKYRVLLDIVESQAQKIKDLNRVGSNTLLSLIEAQEKIAEQKNQIRELKIYVSSLESESAGMC